MAQKLVFDKLKTKQSELQITFDGINYESYNVTSLKANGLEIPDTCDNFDNIKIKDVDNNEIDEFYYLLKDFSNSFYENSKVKRIKINDNINSIGYQAFKGCISLTSITIPNSVTYIGFTAFKDCSSLTSIAIPNSVTKIDDYAFDGCLRLTSIIISDSVTEIGNYIFRNCSSLTSIEISNSTISIGVRAFHNCYNLALITIPNSVTSIGQNAFYNCERLATINYTGTIEEWNAITKGAGWNYNCPENMVIHCTDSE